VAQQQTTPPHQRRKRKGTPDPGSSKKKTRRTERIGLAFCDLSTALSFNLPAFPVNLHVFGQVVGAGETFLTQPAVVGLDAAVRALMSGQLVAAAESPTTTGP